MNQKTLYILAAAILLGIFAALFFFRDAANIPTAGDIPGGGGSATTSDGTPPGAGTEATGRVSEIALSARLLTLIREDGRAVSAVLGDETRVFDEQGRASGLFYLRRGFTLRVAGNFSETNAILAEEVRVVHAPNILVYTPEPRSEVGLPLVIRGEARTFESSFSYRVKDQNGSVLAAGAGIAQSPDVGQFGPFEVRASYLRPATTEGIVEVFEYSAKDGSEINKVSVPVRFREVEAMTVKIFFGERDQGEDCSRVTAVDRRIERTLTPARRALEELLAGPVASEIIAGRTTAINSGVALRMVTIENGVARADFDSMLEAGVGGSCRVQAIRAQITETLRQFPAVESVIISVNGRVQDALQP